MVDETVIFDRKFNDYARKYFIRDGKYNDAELAKTMQADTNFMKEHICQLLLYYDSVCFNVYGENMLIPFLIKTFSQKGFENLLEQKAIRFLLETTSIMHIEKPHPAIQPLCSATMSSEVHKNPQASLEEGLRRCIIPMDRKYKRSISRKILNNFKVHPENINKNIVESVNKSYMANLFEKQGLSAIKDLRELDSKESMLLNRIAQQYLDLAIISYFHYYSNDNYDLNIMSNSELEILKNTNKIEKYTDKTFQFEKVPNFKILIQDGKITPEDIPKLRQNKNSIKFRKWISSVSKQDFDSYDCKEYLDSIDKSKNFWTSNAGRCLKTISVNTVSTILAPTTFGLSLIVGNGLSLLDEFYINSLLKNWSPRFFFSETLNPIIKTKSNYQ